MVEWIEHRTQQDEVVGGGKRQPRPPPELEEFAGTCRHQSRDPTFLPLLAVKIGEHCNETCGDHDHTQLNHDPTPRLDSCRGNLCEQPTYGQSTRTPLERSESRFAYQCPKRRSIRKCGEWPPAGLQPSDVPNLKGITSDGSAGDDDGHHGGTIRVLAVVRAHGPEERQHQQGKLDFIE